MPECRINLLGGLRFEGGGETLARFRTQKTAALLAYLALHPGPQPRELLAGLIWPDDAPEAGRQSLRMALSSLRQQLETALVTSGVQQEPLFEATRFAAGLRSGAFTTDVGDFEAAIREARHASTGQERAYHLGQAVALYEGPFLPGFYDDWCVAQATTLQAAFADALAFLVEWHQSHGETELARAYAHCAATFEIPLKTSSATPAPAPIFDEVSGASPSAPTPVTAGTLLTTLLTLEGPTLNDELAREFADYGGRPLQEHATESLAIWSFAGARGALQSAQALHLVSGKPFRLSICTGEIASDEKAQTSRLRERGWGLLHSAGMGQMLCCEMTALLLRGQTNVEWRDSGEFHLPGALPGAAPERVFQLVWRGDALRESAPLQAVAAHGSLVPQPLGRFFGRECELANLRSHLEAERLVTISGPGGAGKTRLALQFANELQSGPYAVRQVGVYWVPLADVSGIDGFANAILDAMRVPRRSSVSAFDGAIQALNRTHASIVVLDNFEHLVEEGAAWVEGLLERAPQVRCVMTSRRVLSVLGEVELPLAPLAVPASNATSITPQALENEPSVRLFCDRARQVRPDFALTANNAPAIAALCRHLEGIPLALELAAARAGSLSPTRILERLQNPQEADSNGTTAFERFDFLQSASRTTPTRHRTLRTTLDWSFGALESELQSFFLRLSAFRGGCTIEAAEAVCDTPHTLTYLEALRTHSLLFWHAGDEEPRFRMLETVRQYAVQLANERGEMEAARRRHATFFWKWAQSEAPHTTAPDAQARLQSWHLVRGEADNLRAALAWATANEPEMALRLVLACTHFTGVHLSEAEVDIERALHAFEARGTIEKQVPLDILGDALGLAAIHAANRGDFTAQKEFARRRLELVQGSPDFEALGWAMFHWGFALHNNGDFGEARAALEHCTTLFENIDESRRFQTLGWTLTEMGQIALDAGDLETARRDFAVCGQSFERSGDRDGQASAKALLADVAFHQGDTVAAKRLWREVAFIESELGDDRDHPWRRYQEGQLAVALGEPGRGHALLRRALRSFWGNGHQPGVARSLVALSYYWLAQARPDRAIQLLNLESAMRMGKAWHLAPFWREKRDVLEATVRKALPTSYDDDADELLLNLATMIEDELRDE